MTEHNPLSALKAEIARLVALLDAHGIEWCLIDFVDTGHPALVRMWDKRQRGYRAMGYKIKE